MAAHRRNLNLIRRALREQWDIPEKSREDVFAVVEDALAGSDLRARVAACRLILDMGKQNLAGLEFMHKLRVEKILRQLEEEQARVLRGDSPADEGARGDPPPAPETGDPG